MDEILNKFSVKTAEFILHCDDLDNTLDFYTKELGFLLHTIFPADDPSVAVISGYGITIRLKIGDTQQNQGTAIILKCDISENKEQTLIAPNGVQIELKAADPPFNLPKPRPQILIHRFGKDSEWVSGRAGMQYRDLIPDRAGGFLIGSHIRIPGAGPVPDYVHYHRIHFQMIYCLKGSAKLVYEDQGEPFIFREGDCVLQPPEIRHRVLESMGDLEVIEISSPAEHETHRDHELILPTPEFKPDRKFGVQQFLHHRAQNAAWSKWIVDGFTFCDLQVKKASKGIADVKIVRADSRGKCELIRQDRKILFGCILKKNLLFSLSDSEPVRLCEGDSFVIPGGEIYRLSDCSAGMELLLVEFL
ncbi:MAG: cupin domain-containing protein [Pyrinomonadaceae bacterium]